MTLKLKPGIRIFVFDQAIDMRAGFDKLLMIVREKMKAQIVGGDLYLFLGHNRKRLKAICYDGTGVILISKRMERGKFMSISDLEEKEITLEELDWLLRGSTIRRAKFDRLPVDKRTKVPQLLNTLEHGTDRTGIQSGSS